MTDKKTFGAFIKSRRVEKNYSQKDLAELLFVTEGAVSKWERGISYPDLTLVADICRILEISEHEFITASTDTAERRMKLEAKKFRTIRNTWFWVPTISYSVALVVCLICNLAVNHRLSWFFVLLASLVCAYSFVPTYTSFFETGKLLVFAATSYLSICLLLFTAGAYTRSLYWVPVACIGILMGYILLFLPKLLSKTRIGRYRFLIAFGGIWALTLLMMAVIRIRTPFMLLSSAAMATYAFVPVLLGAAVCILPIGGYFKAAVCTAVSGVVYYGTNYVASCLFGPSDIQHYRVDFGNWQDCVNGNISLIFLVACLVLALGFGVAGFYKGSQKK